MGHCDISTGKGHPLLPFFVFLAVLYETNSAGIVCMYNGCNYEKCANGGTCKMTEDCRALCDCPPDFTGRLCGKVNGNQSCTDTCLPGTCHQNESCSQDPTTCKINCSVTGATNGTPCYPFDCIHGVCNNSTCHCDDQWGGNSCNIFCGRNCTRGECRITVGGPGCLCPEGFTPESNCTMETEKHEPEFIEVISLSIPLIIFVVLFPLILVLAFSLIVYVMWKKRMIFVMKIVYYLQKYEDSDGKLYDAFISFRSSDSDEFWVLNTLFPKLENEMGFKICVHHRDFLAGETISNNIIDAIEKSRRTILVVSPDYAEGEWTRMEYQVAQQEMLSLRHKIIPIMFRDIADMPNVDKNLKLIMKSITYVKWPTSHTKKDVDRFWEQLRLTMPKKHEVKVTLTGCDVINEWSSNTRL